jgi:hypothetical protein
MQSIPLLIVITLPLVFPEMVTAQRIPQRMATGWRVAHVFVSALDSVRPKKKARRPRTSSHGGFA